MPEYPAPDSRNPLAEDCLRCPSLVAGRECISWGNGALDADLVAVGEAPGAGTPEADRWKGGNWTGLAYTSRRSGRKVRALFEDLGYDPDELYFTNAVKCFPSDGEGGNREPTPEERENCRPYLRREVETVDPRVVVATGRHAAESLLAEDPVAIDRFTDRVLDLVESPSLGRPVLPILHPSYQEVWISRLGHDYDSYLAAIEAALASA